MIYWNFGFLRMGTSGQTAQAWGRRSLADVVTVLLRSLFFCVLFTMAVWLLQRPVVNLAFALMETTPAVEEYARQYFGICIWGAPAIFGMYSLKGWYIGMQIAIAMNVVNIACSFFFVFFLHMQVRGVALGTLVAQYAGLAISVGLWLWRYRKLAKYFNLQAVFSPDGIKAFMTLNGGIFLRSFCLNAVMSFFTFAGAHQGEVLLAVNVLLLQLFYLFSYFTDGFAYAGEALVGKYVGAGNKARLEESVRGIFRWGLGLVALFTLVYVAGAMPFLAVLTDDMAVRAAARGYYFWVVAVPVAGFAAFLWDGIMVGASAIKPMIYGTFIGSVAFFLIYGLLNGVWGNHALWLAFLVYLALRGVVQTLWAADRRKLERRTEI